MASLGDLLISMRRRRGLTQSDLAATAGRSIHTIQACEQKTARRWEPATALSIARALASVLPFNAEEARLFGQHTELAVELLVSLHRSRPADKPVASEHHTSDSLRRVFSEAASVFGEAELARLLRIMLIARRRRSDQFVPGAVAIETVIDGAVVRRFEPTGDDTPRPRRRKSAS